MCNPPYNMDTALKLELYFQNLDTTIIVFACVYSCMYCDLILIIEHIFSYHFVTNAYSTCMNAMRIKRIRVYWDADDKSHV